MCFLVKNFNDSRLNDCDELDKSIGQIYIHLHPFINLSRLFRIFWFSFRYAMTQKIRFSNSRICSLIQNDNNVSFVAIKSNKMLSQFDINHSQN